MPIYFCEFAPQSDSFKHVMGRMEDEFQEERALAVAGDETARGIYILALAGNEPIFDRAVYAGKIWRKIMGGQTKIATLVSRIVTTISELRAFGLNDGTVTDQTFIDKCEHIFEQIKATKRPLVAYILPLDSVDPLNWEGVLNHNRCPLQYNVEAQLKGMYRELNIPRVAQYIRACFDGERTLYDRLERNKVDGECLCLRCLFTCQNYQAFRKHFKQNHGDLARTIEYASRNVNNRLYIEFCSFDDPRIETYVYCGGKGECTECNNPYLNYQSFQNHFLKSHKEVVATVPQSKNKNNKRFRNYYRLSA